MLTLWVAPIYASLCRSGENKTSNIHDIRSFGILQTGEVLTSFKNDNIANFSAKKSTMKNSRVSIFDNTRKTDFKSVKSRSHSRI